MDLMDRLAKIISEGFGISEGTARANLETAAAERILFALAADSGAVDVAAIEAIHKKESELRKREQDVKFREEMVDENSKNLQEEAKRINDRIDELDETDARILSFETPEARDRMRMYEIFKRDAFVDTPQNRSVYIAGLAQILSGTRVWKFGEPD